ncbi:cysteine hydrolase [Bradyrhizobium sp. CCGUVB1N3]|uniref:isochorismatase family cysteine hydrolase n=1 Tax=Bradyrhizobium sp. CCGUVB1N3 TaxID=2949629 RepID=UPI0020B25EA8|nr:isochorismatase family cysteine hydrolase [Bradyrhizobium sp. CCGUVB1N3]MCP3476728.1 cysteine hydrolase [Bradyrhizobium sp. CCGUVB1N3]
MKTYVYGDQRELPPGFEEFTSLKQTVAVCIDLHQGHLADDPDCPCPAPRAREIVSKVDVFHRAARALGVPVIHVRSELRKNGSDDIHGVKAAWRMVFPLHVGPIANSDAHAIEGSRWTQFATEVKEDDLIVNTKKRLSAFYPSDLDFLLRNLGTRRIVFTGCMADCCVLNSAFDASNLGYRVTVLADLVRGTDPAMEAAALKMVSLHLGLVADSNELLHCWRDQRI